MAFFSETQSSLNLSGKTTEELVSIQKELHEKKLNIGSERVKINKTLRLCDIQLKDIDKNLQTISNEIKRREDIEESNNIIIKNIKTIRGFVESLSEEELSIITTKMDKTDYRKYGEYPRYLDLERICNEVIDMKKKYPNWTLTNLANGGQYDTMPPQTFYKYEYKDEHGNYFNLGGITLISR